MRILIVDDNEIVTRGIRRLLRDHEVAIDSDPDEALARFDAGEHFDLIMCDLHMPKRNGIEIMDATRARFGVDAPTLVLMTGSSDDPPASVDAVLRKPFQASELHAVLALARAHKLRRCNAATLRLPVLPLVAG